MGSIWSQTATARQEVPRVPPQKLPQENEKKRKADQLVHSHLPKDGGLASSPASEPLNFDATPDGESHRYIVDCSKMYWFSRKDVMKELRKIHGMPPFGGVNKIPKWEYFVITFPNASCAEAGVKKLQSKSYRGEAWDVRKTSVKPPPKKPRASSKQTASILTAADATAKWRDMPYDAQIQQKVRQWLDALCSVTKNVAKEVKDISYLPWLQDLMHDRKKSAPCCPLVQVSPAHEDSRSYYRNKNEFSVGMSRESYDLNNSHHASELTIGYALGLVRDGEVNIASVDEQCITTSKTAIAVAKCLTPILRESGLPPYDKFSHKGYWRQITCRESKRTGELIVVFLVSSLYEEDCENLKRKEHSCKQAILHILQTEFSQAKKLGVFWQSSSSSSVATDSTPEHLFGIRYLHEELFGLRFRIDPSAFFQVNTNMTEVLYSVIGDLAAVDKKTVILDMCCGTGTIGLSLASRCHSVVGVEMNAEAVVDAEYNARVNGIENAKFIAGKAEEKIRDALNLLDSDPELSCVAILDPPRAGLQTKVIAAMRANPAIRKVVYVACEPKNLWRNALALCRPRSKAFQLEPFHPVKAHGVDLFPQTHHSELVVLFERGCPKQEE